MTDAFKIGIAGLGTVGTGVIKILTQNADIIAARAGRPIEIMAVSARSKNKDRGVDLSNYDWVDDAGDMAARDDLDCVVELIGGSEGLAADLVRGALNGKKHVVTANKALVAHHGYELAEIAEGNGVSLNYEAAVAGGIPGIKAMREGLAANKFSAVYGILNGTCNYILTEMRETGRDFADVLKDAQEAGYAEADPTFDVEGVDAAHKLCILSSIAFGVKPDFEALTVSGISRINATDITFASEFGYRIKLLGVAQEVDGEILQVVEPCVVPIGSPLGAIEDVYNAVYVDGNFVETPLLTGKGAGEGPTASSVVADIIDLARGISLPTFGVPVSQLKDLSPLDAGACKGSYYLRLNVLDQPGVLAEVSAILRDHNISVEGMSQHGRDPDQPVPIVLTTHEAIHADMVKAAELIEALDFCVETPCLMVVRDI